MSFDNELIERIEARIDRIENRLSILELKGEPAGVPPEVIELNLELPDADIGGLRFNKTEVRAAFNLKDDGLYYSRDILFISARDTDEGTGRDLLLEYLESARFKLSLANAIFSGSNGLKEKYDDKVALINCLEIFLPETNQGVKKYNGVTCAYWLSPGCSDSGARGTSFRVIQTDGDARHALAGYAGGCAPAFRVRAAGGEE